MKLFARTECTRQRTPEQRRRDDAIVLASSLFTVFLAVFVVLFS